MQETLQQNLFSCLSILLSWGRTGCAGGKWCVHNASWLVRMDEVRTWVCRQWQKLSFCQTTLPRICHTAHARVQFILENILHQVQRDTSHHVPFQPSHNFSFVYLRTPQMPVTSLAATVAKRVRKWNYSVNHARHSLVNSRSKMVSVKAISLIL